MVIHVIFAFASAWHNGTPSRCSSVTVITTPRASVGMRSEFDITASFIIRANVKWLIHQKAVGRFQGRGFILNLQTPCEGKRCSSNGFPNLRICLKGTQSGWTFECRCPTQVSIRLRPFTWFSREQTHLRIKNIDEKMFHRISLLLRAFQPACSQP